MSKLHHLYTFLKIISLKIKELYTIVAAIAHPQSIVTIDTSAVAQLKLTPARAPSSPGLEMATVPVVTMNACIFVAIGHVNITVRRYNRIRRFPEGFSITSPRLTGRTNSENEIPFPVKLPDTVI